MTHSDDWPDGDSAIMLDGRRMCVDCQCPSRHLEDMRCPRCNQPDLVAQMSFSSSTSTSRRT